MKNNIKITLSALSLLFFSCTDVVDVEVQSDTSRLVIEASLDWEKGTTGNVQTIKLRNSSPFFDTTTNTAVTGAMVKVTNDTNGMEFQFDDQNNGTYTTDVFEPILGQTYTLEVVYNDEVYKATETLNAVPDITEIYQGTEDGFDQEALEVHVVFTDPPEKGNSYLFKFDIEGELLPDLEVAYDEFINGNEVDWWYEKEENEEEGEDADESEGFQPGETVGIEMYAISMAYKNYLEILTSQLGGVGLFEATPVSLRGNCINETNPENYAHGYFRLTEYNDLTYTFE